MAWAEEVAEALEPVLPEDAETALEEGFGPLTVTVPADRWPQALELVRDRLGCAFFDWLSAVDELAEGFSVLCHLARVDPAATGRREAPEEAQTGRGVRHLLVRTRVPREAPVLPSVADVYAGAAWHERETSEMFGIAFSRAEAGADGAGDAAQVTEVPVAHLLLPDEFEGHPLRKDFVLASRVAKPWPGAKEPGESEHEGGSPSRRRTRPPGAPAPDEWGPREPGSPAPDPLAHAQPGAARPRRGARQRPEREQPDG